MTSPQRFLRRRTVLAKVGISSTLLFNLEKAGKFPLHILLTPRCAVWSEVDVDEWMKQRIDAGTKTVVGRKHRQICASSSAAAGLPKEG
jgi:prophage regulatory protein